MLPAIHTLFAYNTWATDKLLDQLAPLSADELETNASGHGSILKTLNHLLDVQWDYTAWFDGSLDAAESSKVHVDMPTIEIAKQRWLEIDRQTSAMIAALDEAALDKIWDWGKGALPLGPMLLHVANHQTHTRGQMLAAIRRLGRETQGLDLLFFLYARSKGKA